MLVAAVAGARGAGKSRLIDAISQAMQGNATLIRARLQGLGLDASLAESLTLVQWREAPGYPPTTGKESRKNRSAQQTAVSSAIDVDLVLLVIDGRKGLQPGDVSFAQEWDRFFITHPEREAPPTLVVVTGVDQPDFGVIWRLRMTGRPARECAKRPSAAVSKSLRATLPPTFNTFTAAGLPAETAFGVVEHVIPALAAALAPRRTRRVDSPAPVAFRPVEDRPRALQVGTRAARFGST